MFYRFPEGRRGVNVAVAKRLSSNSKVCRKEAYVAFNESANCRENILMPGDIFKGIWTVFFHPAESVSHILDYGKISLTKASYLELPLANLLQFSSPFHWRLTS